MKNLCSTILFLFFAFQSGIAQNSFTLVYGGEESKRPNCIKTIGNYYYMLTCDFVLPSYRGNAAEVVLISANGNVLKKKELYSEGQISGPLRKILPLNDSELLLLGGYRADDTGNTSIWLIKIDTSLNVIWEKFLPTNVKYLEKINYVVNDSNNIALLITLTTGTPNVAKSLLFYELTIEGEIVRSKYENTGNPITTNGYSIISNSNGYYAFVDGFSSYLPVPGYGFSERLDLDTNFNIIRAQSIPEGMNGYMTADRINEHSYYLAGNQYYTGFYTETGIQKTDTSNTIIYSNHSGLPGNIADGPAWLECLSAKDDNIIYTGGNGHDYGGFQICNLLRPRSFILSNFDSLLNCRWTKYYGSDTACYYMMDLDATDDGGCIMAGTILSPNTNPNKTDVIIIKVDSEGLITSSNKPGTRVMQALVYPNPGDDYLMLQTGRQNIGAIFTLHNLSGQKLIEQTVNSTSQHFSGTGLPSGSYVWSLNKGNSVIETGKWIKQ